jgi:hypothetical protein
MALSPRALVAQVVLIEASAHVAAGDPRNRATTVLATRARHAKN